MKKFFASIAAVMLIAFSAVPAFAYDSPEATTAPSSPDKTPSKTTTTGGGKAVVVDNGVSSPKTGSSDTAAYMAIALSLTACGAAGAALLKSKASK